MKKINTFFLFSILSKGKVVSCGKNLRSIQAACEQFQVIAVDEGQFVGKLFIFQILLLFVKFDDIVEFCENLANSGKIVLVSALDGDYKRKVRV